MTKLKDLKAKWLEDAAVKAEYDALAEEFSIADALISARKKAAMTQAEVAEKMETSQSYIAKLEAGKVSPSFKVLKKYARATGSRLSIHLEPIAA